jgi:hypothetical protein
MLDLPIIRHTLPSKEGISDSWMLRLVILEFAKIQKMF